MSIIHTSTKSPLEILPFHKAVMAACTKGANAQQTMRDAIAALIKSRYKVFPTYAQYRADQDALAELSKGRGLMDNQYARKAYAKAMHDVYGALPLTTGADAVAKRAQRLKDLSELHRTRYQEAFDAARKHSTSLEHAEALACEAVKSAKADDKKAGAPAGQTHNTQPSPAESLEQWITKHDLFAVLDACARILAADKRTSPCAKQVAAGSHAARLALAPAETDASKAARKAA